MSSPPDLGVVSEDPTKDETTPLPDTGSGSQLYVLFAVAAFSPMMVWVNAGESPVLFTLLVAFSLIVGVGLAARFALIRIGLDPLGSTFAVSAFLFVFTNGGVWMGEVEIGRWAWIGIGLLVSVLSYRLRNLGVFRLMATWAAFVLVGSPIVTWVSNSTDSTLNIEPVPPFTLSEFQETPDVLMVVMDAYASPLVLRDVYSHDVGPFTGFLAENDFEVADSALANYSMTQLSVPSFMDMAYPVVDAGVSDADVDVLLEKLGGSNRFAGALKAEGYRQVYVESGWLGTRCGADVDVCVRAPWPDETMADVGYRTLLVGLPGFELGRSFTRGATSALTWLEEELDGYLNDDVPDFIYVHLLVPHPPLFVDGECQTDFATGVPGFALGAPWSSDEEMRVIRDGYVEQVDCVNTALTSIVSRNSGDDVMIFLGDHGPDSLHQLYRSDGPWSDQQKLERLTVFLAARVPGCDTGDIGSIVNVGRRVLSCLSGEELPDLPDRTLTVQRVDSNVQVAEVEVHLP